MDKIKLCSLAIPQLQTTLTPSFNQKHIHLDTYTDIRPSTLPHVISERPKQGPTCNTKKCSPHTYHPATSSYLRFTPFLTLFFHGSLALYAPKQGKARQPESHLPATFATAQQCTTVRESSDLVRKPPCAQDGNCPRSGGFGRSCPPYLSVNRGYWRLKGKSRGSDLVRGWVLQVLFMQCCMSLALVSPPMSLDCVTRALLCLVPQGSAFRDCCRLGGLVPGLWGK
jgi:hypothetical protein